MVFGLVLFDPIATVFVSTMSFVLYLLIDKITQFVLSFQQYSGVVSNDTFKLLKFIWFTSVIGFFINIATSVLSEPPQEAYFHISFSIVYFGFAVAASKKWDFTYKTVDN